MGTRPPSEGPKALLLLLGQFESSSQARALPSHVGHSPPPARHFPTRSTLRSKGSTEVTPDSPNFILFIALSLHAHDIKRLQRLFCGVEGTP